MDEIRSSCRPGLAVSTNFAGNSSAGFVANNAGTLTVTGAGNSFGSTAERLETAERIGGLG